MSIKMNREEKIVFSFSFISFVASFILIRLSGFSSSSIVNLENYVIKNIILQASTSTFAAVYSFLSPFYLVFLALILLVLGISVVCYYGYSKSDSDLGKLLGLVTAVFALLLFPTIVGAFLAVSVFLTCFYSPKLSNMYSKELKKWVPFRLGSNTTGKVLSIVNILIAVGIFVSVLANQPVHAASFRQDITASMKSIAVTLPGASAIPSQDLQQRIEAAVESSPIIMSYITWLPATAAFMAWIILEFLRHLILANIGGLFTYIMIRKSR